MERANTITYLKGETIGTEMRKKGNKGCAATGLEKFPKNINRLHVTQLSIVCPFKYLVYMERQRKERPKKKQQMYCTGHEVSRKKSTTQVMRLKARRSAISPGETTNAIHKEPEGVPAKDKAWRNKSSGHYPSAVETVNQKVSPYKHKHFKHCHSLSENSDRFKLNFFFSKSASLALLHLENQRRSF
uniref:Uncharacterized protein n=1 Tax=Gallus gallus TaxID=9031 RepID=A0A8V1AJM7_CHICK